MIRIVNYLEKQRFIHNHIYMIIMIFFSCLESFIKETIIFLLIIFFFIITFTLYIETE